MKAGYHIALTTAEASMYFISTLIIYNVEAQTKN